MDGTAVCEREELRQESDRHEIGDALGDAPERRSAASSARRYVELAPSPDASTVEQFSAPQLPITDCCDDYVAVVRVNDPSFTPQHPRQTPFACSFRLPFDLANLVAVELNIGQLYDDLADRYWYVVARSGRKHFRVMRVTAPEGWRPLDEFELPPGCDAGPSGKRTALKAAVEFNRQMLSLGLPIRWWAVVVRPLEPDQLFAEGSEALRRRKAKRKLWDAGRQCAYCNRWIRHFRAATVDHVEPLSQGGSRKGQDNLVLCCKQCNWAKGARTPEEWAADVLAGAQRTLAAVKTISLSEDPKITA